MTNTVTARLNNVTIAGNTADSDNNGVGDGGGIRIFAGTFEVRNSIIAGNFDNSPSVKHNDCSGLIQSLGHNLIQDSFGCAIGGSTLEDLYGKDPLLAPLADNGGPTRTRALLPGSPAIDAGNPVPSTVDELHACADVDQRGVPRPIGRFCDSGAYEAPLWRFLPLIRR
ncbi:MAG: hypothetical protein E6J26_05765 [Chloroflexi bacterium]|nr:MAG: hypothetical protein E6J26_05765 [Chloroflexota bacterium]